MRHVYPVRMHHEQIPWGIFALGRVPDRAIADFLGVAETSVRRARKRREIPALHQASPEALRERVLRALGDCSEEPSSVVYAAVLDDFGTVSRRQVLRVVSQLIQEGVVARVPHLDKQAVLKLIKEPRRGHCVRDYATAA